MGAVDGQRAFGLADRVAARQELGSHGRLVGPRPRRRTRDPRTELTPSHYRELGVEPVVFVTPLRQLPVPLVPPPLPYTRSSGRVVSGVSGPRFESRRGLSCLSRQLLRYAALGTGCAVPRTTQSRCYFYMRSKADLGQLTLPHGTNN